jgi:hypothetical protein
MKVTRMSCGILFISSPAHYQLSINKMIRVKPILLIFSILAACQPPNPAPELDKVTIETSVRKMFGDYHQAIKEGGLTAEFKYLDDSEDFFWVPPGYTSALTYDSVKAILETNAGMFRSVEFHWDTLQLYPLSNTLVNYTGIVSGTMTDTAGQTSSVSIIETGIVILRNDGWKLLSGQSANLTD